MTTQAWFNQDLFRFLKQLRRNNNRDWFLANKQRYEAVVRDPCLRFITDLAQPLHQISPWLVADPRPARGSLFRIYRDIRFSADKHPYKTHVGMHFSHGGAGKNVHAPGFYLHLEPGLCFAAAGSWHPDARALTRIRDAIAQRPEAWKKARHNLVLEGDSLSRPPRGYNPNHPLVEDLKRKDFVASVDFTEASVCRPQFMADFVRACMKMSPLVEFLSKALGLRF